MVYEVINNFAKFGNEKRNDVKIIKLHFGNLSQSYKALYL